MSKRNGMMTAAQRIERIRELQNRLGKALSDGDIAVARFWTHRIKSLLDILPPRRSKMPWGPDIGTDWDLKNNFSRKYWSKPDRHLYGGVRLD